MREFTDGIKAGLPIGLGYLSVSFTFGIIAITYGLNWCEALAISMLTVTSAGQFAGIHIMLNPGHYIEMLISQLTINVRYSFMSISLSQKVNDKFKGIYRWLLGFMITDEIFGVAIARGEVSRSFFAGLCVLPYIGWSLGTLLGALLGNVLPESVMSALSLAIYGMFIAIVVPECKRGKPIIMVVLLSLLLSCAFFYIPILKSVSSGLSISICAIVAATLGAIFFPVEDDEASAK